MDKKITRRGSKVGVDKEKGWFEIKTFMTLDLYFQYLRAKVKYELLYEKSEWKILFQIILNETSERNWLKIRYYKDITNIMKFNYIRMRRKIIDDFRLQYLNDLFELSLIILRYESYIATFRICMEATFFSRF